MPTAEQTIVIDGEFGLETNVSQHSGDLKTFRVFRDLATDVKRRIVKREGRGTTLGSVAGVEIHALHEFTNVNPVSGDETYYVIGAIDSGSFLYVWDGTSTWTGQTLPISPTQGGRWGFANVGSPSALLAFNGKDQLLIARQAGTTITLTSVGTTATATSSTPHGFSNGESITIVGASPSAYNGTYTITVGSTTTFTYTFAGGSSPATGTIRADARRLVWRVAGQAAPTFAATYSLTTNDPSVTNLSTGTTVSITKGSRTVTNSGTAFVTGSSWVGKRILLNSIPYTIASVSTTSSLTLTEEVREDTVSGISWTVYPGVGDWDIGPQYTWAYYNEDTGHCSNAAPILAVTERSQVGRTITLTIAGSAENTTAYNNGYRKIRIFRTAKNAGIPCAINELVANNNAGSAITYVETTTKIADTYLTDLEAPSLNRVPPTGIASVAYHQGRAWFLVPREGKVYFTPLSVELSLGVNVESCPALYYRDMGGLRGLVVIGGASSADTLVIQTSHGDFSVDGFDSTTFSLYRLPTSESGSYLGSAASVRRNLVEFYADKRLLSGDNDLARNIQDKLTDVKDSLVSKARLHHFSARSYNLLMLSVPKNSSSTANDYTYVFDLDRPDGKGGFATYEWNFGVSAFATAHNATTRALELLIGDATGATYKLFTGAYQDALANYTPQLLTSLMRLPEKNAKIKYINAYLSDDSATLSGRLYWNEQTNSAATDGTVVPLTFFAPDYRTQSAQGRKFTTGPFTESLRSRGEVFQIELTFPTTSSFLAIEKIVIGFDATTEAVSKS